MPEYGHAIDGITDTAKTWGSVGGLKNLGNSIARRLTTLEGSLIYDPGYGFDVRQLLNGVTTTRARAEAIGKIESQCVQDERITAATAEIQPSGTNEMVIKLLLTNSDAETFSLVLSVTQLTVELLTIEAST